MKERQERIERLVERWLAAQTTDGEERELREWFRQTDDIPDSLREVRVLLGGLDALAEERLPGRTGAFAGRRSKDGPSRPLRRRLTPFWGVAAAAAVALGLFFCAELLRKPYCYIDGVAVYDRETAMQTTVYFESFAAIDESSRMVDELIRNN